MKLLAARKRHGGNETKCNDTLTRIREIESGELAVTREIIVVREKTNRGCFRNWLNILISSVKLKVDVGFGSESGSQGWQPDWVPP